MYFFPTRINSFHCDVKVSLSLYPILNVKNEVIFWILICNISQLLIFFSFVGAGLNLIADRSHFSVLKDLNVINEDHP